MNHFAIARDAILRKRFSMVEAHYESLTKDFNEEPTKPHTYNADFEDMEIPLVGEDVEYGELKETKESRDERS